MEFFHYQNLLNLHFRRRLNENRGVQFTTDSFLDRFAPVALAGGVFRF